MNFASDNWAGAHPRIAESLKLAAGDYGPAYGGSDLDRQAEERFREIFDCDLSVFFVGTGTAANALGLAAMNRPGGVVFCHREAHLIIDEGGATEFLTGGARLCPVNGPLGRVDPAALSRAIGDYPPEFIHHGQPMGASITQVSEQGTIYRPEQIRAISDICDAHGLPLHMDGARFANAVAGLGESPAAITREAGVDVLSFGATKNGCWCAEAVVIFKPELARDFVYIRKRAAQLFSKSRFIAAQFLAYFENGLWLEIADHANAMAARLAGIAVQSNKMRLAWPCEANEVFVVMEEDDFNRLQAAGVLIYPWSAPPAAEGGEGISVPGEGEVIARMVTSFATTPEDIERFGELI